MLLISWYIKDSDAAAAAVVIRSCSRTIGRGMIPYLLLLLTGYQIDHML